MNDKSHFNEEYSTSSVGERLQHHQAVMSNLQVWMKVLRCLFWIGIAVTAFITLPFYYALGAVYVVALMMIIVWAAWQMVRGKA